MTSDLPRLRNYAKANVTFFVEEMIEYVLRRHGINLNLGIVHMQELRAISLYNFTPSIGDAVIFVALQQRERIMNEVSPIWDYIRSLSQSVKGDVLQSSIIIMGIRVLNEGDDQNNVFVLMAIVTKLCILICQNDNSTLIRYTVTALEYIFNNAVQCGFPRIIIWLTTQALRMRTLYRIIAG